MQQKRICPSCGAETTGSVCEYCGSAIIVPEIRHEQKKTSSNQEVLVYSCEISSDEALRLVKSAVLSYLEQIAQQASKREFWEYINPIDEKKELFTYRANLYYVPFYLFEFKAEINKQIKSLNYIGFAGDSKSYPYCVQKNFESIDGLQKYIPENKAKIKGLQSNGFIKDCHKIWCSVYADREKRKFINYDYPDIKRIFLPFYVINVSVRDHTGTTIEKDVVIDCKGDIVLRKGITSSPYMLANYFLGNDYMAILDKKRSDRKQEQKRCLNEKRKTRITASKQKKYRAYNSVHIIVNISRDCFRDAPFWCKHRSLRFFTDDRTSRLV